MSNKVSQISNKLTNSGGFSDLIGIYQIGFGFDVGFDYTYNRYEFSEGRWKCVIIGYWPIMMAFNPFIQERRVGFYSVKNIIGY